MSQYTRKPNAVEAFRYDKQAQKDWPQWLLDHRITTSMGIQPVGTNMGLINIPQRHGPTVAVEVGDWVVLEDGVLTAYKDEAFQAAFDGADAPVADAPTAEAAPAAEPAPTETPAAEPAAAEQPAPTTGRGRGKAGGTPAEDAPAAEPEA